MTHCAAATLSHAVMEGLLATKLTVSDKLKINDLMLVLDGWINFEKCLKCTQATFTNLPFKVMGLRISTNQVSANLLMLYRLDLQPEQNKVNMSSCTKFHQNLSI